MAIAAGRTSEICARCRAILDCCRRAVRALGGRRISAALRRTPISARSTRSDERSERWASRAVAVSRASPSAARTDRTPMPRVSETCFRQSLIHARHQSALSLELRAATSLARLQRDRGDTAHGLAIALQPVYDRFTDRFATEDLRTARPCAGHTCRAGYAFVSKTCVREQDMRS